MGTAGSRNGCAQEALAVANDGLGPWWRARERWTADSLHFFLGSMCETQLKPDGVNFLRVMMMMVNGEG